VKFWDASAVVPLLVPEPSSDPLLALLAADTAMLIWWGTPVEVSSALARREREGKLSGVGVTRALDRLRTFAAAWSEILPVEAIRVTAQRLLRIHPLRAPDALQLAAAMMASENDPASLQIVSLDERLNEIAAREGFGVVESQV
jgi:predicted nucleic acid-binding protein